MLGWGLPGKQGLSIPMPRRAASCRRDGRQRCQEEAWGGGGPNLEINGQHIKRQNEIIGIRQAKKPQSKRAERTEVGP